MFARALWRSEALRVVPWLLAYGSCRVSNQGTTLRASDLHNARATILNSFTESLQGGGLLPNQNYIVTE